MKPPPSFSQPSLQNRNQSFLGCYNIPLKINLVATSDLIFFHLDPSVESSLTESRTTAKQGTVLLVQPAKILRRKLHKKTSE